MGKKYLETKKDSLESSILGLWQKAVEVTETNKNDKSDDGEGLDAVQPKAVKKKFKDRKDKDIDNDGDTDDSDEFLHKKRKAISKAMAKEEVELKEKPADFIRLSFRSPADVKKVEKWIDQNLSQSDGGFTGMYPEGQRDIAFENVRDAEDLMAKLKKAGFKFKMDYREEVTWGNAQQFKIQSMKAALAKVWGVEEGHNPFAEHKGTKPDKHPHEEDEVEEGLEDSPNSANKQHLCAKNVVHEEWGSGQCVATQHADPDEEGNVAWYDVMFEHGIEKGVSINELKVTKAEDHNHSKKKMKKEINKTETGKKPATIDLKPKLGESVELTEGRMKELHGYIKDGKSAKEIAKIMKVDVKTIKALMDQYETHTGDGMEENGKYMEMLAAACNGGGTSRPPGSM